MALLPADLQPEHFAKYPPEAREVAAANISLLRRLPLAFVPLLLREIIEYDWKFPVERRALDRQLAYLASLGADTRGALLASFAGLTLSSNLEQMDWVGDPARFSEQLTSFLWSSSQIDSFRNAAIGYIQKLNAAVPDEPPPAPRLGIVVVGRGVADNNYPLFRKLRPRGVRFTQVDPQGGLQTVLQTLTQRAGKLPAPFAHWYIDGGAPERAPAGVSRVSYESLAPVRLALIERMRKIEESRTMGPEALVTALAQIRPADLGLPSDVLNYFQVGLLTQGSGTQVFSTTFVQWAARETLRRAQPLTLLARFAPRQRERSLNELLTGTALNNDLDAPGALVDADMGGYYTWLNQQRLSGAEKSSFVIWFEGHSEALAAGPAFPPGTESNERVRLAQIFSRIA